MYQACIIHVLKNQLSHSIGSGRKVSRNGLGTAPENYTFLQGRQTIYLSIKKGDKGVYVWEI